MIEISWSGHHPVTRFFGTHSLGTFDPAWDGNLYELCARVIDEIELLILEGPPWGAEDVDVRCQVEMPDGESLSFLRLKYEGSERRRNL